MVLDVLRTNSPTCRDDVDGSMVVTVPTVAPMRPKFFLVSVRQLGYITITATNNKQQTTNNNVSLHNPTKNPNGATIHRAMSPPTTTYNAVMIKLKAPNNKAPPATPRGDLDGIPKTAPAKAPPIPAATGPWFPVNASAVDSPTANDAPTVPNINAPCVKLVNAKDAWPTLPPPTTRPPGACLQAERAAPAMAPNTTPPPVFKATRRAQPPSVGPIPMMPCLFGRWSQ